MFAVRIGQHALAELAAQLNLRDIAQTQARLAGRVAAQHDVLHILHGADEALSLIHISEPTRPY